MMRNSRPLCASALGGIAALTLSIFASERPAEAQAREQKGPISVLLTYKFKSEDRPAIRETMATVGAAQFEKWKDQGIFKEYLILFQPYVRMNSSTWDMLVVLDFERYMDLDNWKKIERTMPGGLPAKALALATPESTYLAQILGQKNLHSGESGKNVYLVSHYKFKVEPPAGIPFVNSYVLPQMEPFIRDKVLAGYGVYLNLHDISDWSYLVIFDYADSAAFGSRNKAGPRAALSENPAWVALRAVRMEFREEYPEFFTERILPR